MVFRDSSSPHCGSEFCKLKVPVQVRVQIRFLQDYGGRDQGQVAPIHASAPSYFTPSHAPTVLSQHSRYLTQLHSSTLATQYGIQSVVEKCWPQKLQGRFCTRSNQIIRLQGSRQLQSAGGRCRGQPRQPSTTTAPFPPLISISQPA